jgi:hypothetical protein
LTTRSAAARSAAPTLAATARSAAPAWAAAGPSRAALAHFFELLLLIFREDLGQLGVDVFLQCVELFLLLGRHLQCVL